jgi:hypothetical protein
LREKSGKKVGGQPGYKGNYRLQSDRPDEVVKHAVSACGHCGEDWTQTPVQKIIKRQAWDWPEKIPLKAVEHPKTSFPRFSREKGSKL